jgi:hypothetical protein
MNTIDLYGLKRCDACGIFHAAKWGHIDGGIDIDVSGGYGAAIDTFAGPISLRLCASCSSPVLALVALSQTGPSEAL